MYVIMDLEWSETYKANHFPTQLSALRVDHQWNPIDSFSSLIYPRFSDFSWKHMGFTGYSSQDFLAAPPFSQVAEALNQFLNDDDILLWWHCEAPNVFTQHLKLWSLSPLTQPSRIFASAVREKSGMKGDPHQISTLLGLTPQPPAHVSIKDTETLRLLLSSLFQTPQELSPHTKDWTASDIQGYTPSSDSQKPYDFYYDPSEKLLHTKNCECLNPQTYLQGYPFLKTCIKKKLKPCPKCCEEIYRRTARALTKSVIRHTFFRYVYRPHSEVFHTPKCIHALSIPYMEISGARYYNTCVAHGRRPCRICKPTTAMDPPPHRKFNPPILEPQITKKAPPPVLPGMTRRLTGDEMRALNRHLQATKERKEQNTNLSRNDFFTRTTSSYAFFASRGYSTFHLPHCQKLNGLTELIGFSRCEQAIAHGLTPCRLCKPSSKHDLNLSIPSGGKIRYNETADVLDSLCSTYGYAHEKLGNDYYISTPVGKWRVNLTSRPIKLWHINLVCTHGSPDHYHLQPRMILSLTDAFHYIHHHDSTLAKTTSYQMTPTA